ncbi:MAG: SLC13 family permease [Aphanocapsa feldmannii 277cI]|uniref:SLC13 family permease n=1 Tax=Aphanocapsa feldmannii 277cI TaxID=2507554 RepID=A0A524RUV4_9CHRO|nr:MAG: SLC13 family permease [Aphanocapsa feldmannii 288cV]TGH25761.1 MAG: SLC13 family permease [Aphanocapsa feldmannii 277cI]
MQATITLLVLSLAVVLFISGALPPEVSGLLCMALLVVCGVLTPDEALAGFGSTTVMTLLAMFALSAGLFRSGALDRLRERMGGDDMRSQGSLMRLFVIWIGPLAGVLANTPIVASLIPMVENWCRRRGIPASRLLLPLSTVTILGGTLTLLGTSTNLLASDVSRSLGEEMGFPGGLELFTLTPIAIPLYLVGGAYLLWVAPRLLPDRDRDGVDLLASLSRDGYVTEVAIPPDSELVGQTLRNSRLQRRFDVDVLELQRGGERFSPPFAERVLNGGDRLLLRCSREDLLRLQQEHTVALASQPLPARLDPFGQEDTEQRMVEVLLPAGSLLAGASLRELRFRQRYNATVMAMRRGQELVRERLGQLVLKAGDVLLLQAPLDSIRGLQSSNDLVVMEQLEKDLPTTRKKYLAISIAAVSLLSAGFGLLPLFASVLLGVVAMVACGCLRPGELQRSVRWEVILLLGSVYCFSTAMDKTGLAQTMADVLVAVAGDWSPLAVLMLTYLITTLSTEVMSNAAAVVLWLPVATRLALDLGLPPMAFVVCIVFAASWSFLTPVGYQTNLMVFAAGGYRFIDIVRFGAPLTLMVSVLVPLLVALRYGLLG